MAYSVALPWSDGEHRMHQLLNVPEHDNPTSNFLTPQATFAANQFPLAAFSVLDSENRPWTTVWGGEPGFSQALGGNLLGTRTFVDNRHDPVIEAMVDQQFGKGNPKGMMFSGLPIDLVRRKRVKIAGRIVAGGVKAVGEEDTGVGEIQVVTKIDESLGNCPKYLNEKEIRPAIPNPKLISVSPQLSKQAEDLIKKADLFFLSTANADINMDTNHRGGPPGFVRVISSGNADEATAASIIYPEYSGNRLYQSLGNLLNNPAIGICVPDFETGDVLYITGTAEVLIGDKADEFLPRTNLAVKITIIEARHVENGLPFRGRAGEESPYNPHVRLLASEGNVASKFEKQSQKHVLLVSSEELSPTLSRYRFRSEEPVKYKPGQWAAFDFSEELDIGYSHMRDDDPTSLNDDFVRTFTVSSHPADLPANEFEITARLHGPVTAHLKRQRNFRTPLEVPMKGFGGDFKIDLGDSGVTPFIAGGAGITPLLGQIRDLDVTKMHLFWTTKLEDAAFVLETVKKHSGLANTTTVFFTSSGNTAASNQKIDQLRDVGVDVKMRRPMKDDFISINSERFYLCAGNPFRKTVLEWLAGKEVIYESFDY
ncbi:oxidoreductase-like protein [Microthyrium microscopicum]|uniref:Oxidoreductase-like protein n=1 Tax=Microthyrium microscopicum TaxID=703497 RepID=A0A6A6UGA6_9PEZI|nr:oxidoreductase-like protein [Microthyrium microscopicum]